MGKEPRFDEAWKDGQRKALDQQIKSPITPPRVKDSLKLARKGMDRKPRA